MSALSRLSQIIISVPGTLADSSLCCDGFCCTILLKYLCVGIIVWDINISISNYVQSEAWMRMIAFFIPECCCFGDFLPFLGMHIFETAKQQRSGKSHFLNILTYKCLHMHMWRTPLYLCGTERLAGDTMLSAQYLLYNVSFEENPLIRIVNTESKQGRRCSNHRKKHKLHIKMVLAFRACCCCLLKRGNCWNCMLKQMLDWGGQASLER